VSAVRSKPYLQPTMHQQRNEEVSSLILLLKVRIAVRT